VPKNLNLVSRNLPVIDVVMSGIRLSGLNDLVSDLRSDIRCFSGSIRSVVQYTVVHSTHSTVNL